MTIVHGSEELEIEKNEGPIDSGYVYRGTCSCGGGLAFIVIRCSNDKVLGFRQHEGEDGSMTLLRLKDFREVYPERLLAVEAVAKDFPEFNIS